MSNFVLRNVEITADKPLAIYNAQNVRLENCKITTPEGVNQLATANAKVEVTPP